MAKSNEKAAILWSFSDPVWSVQTYEQCKCQKALAWMKCHILIPKLGLKVELRCNEKMMMEKLMKVPFFKGR